jgi:hypothetical protein
MDFEAQRLFVLITLTSTAVGTFFGMWSWLETGNPTARILVIVSLVVFAPVYYVFERRYNRRRVVEE